jgi:hypothetical protein
LIGIARAPARNDADRVRPAPMGARAAALHGEKSPARASQTRPWEPILSFNINYL